MKVHDCLGRQSYASVAANSEISCALGPLMASLRGFISVARDLTKKCLGWGMGARQKPSEPVWHGKNSLSRRTVMPEMRLTLAAQTSVKLNKRTKTAIGFLRNH
jgi:hypothetical protein